MFRGLALTIGVILTVACNPYTAHPSDAGPDKGDGPTQPPTDARRDGPTTDGNQPAQDWTNVLPKDAKVTWSPRPCSTTVRYTGSGGTVQVAGSFTSWKPVAMQAVAGGFEYTLQPGTGLESGKRYPYKFVVDSNWVLDRSAAWRMFDGNCLNSALLMPDCQNGPEIVADKTQASLSGSQGSATVSFKVLASADGEAPTEILVNVDGKALPASAAKLDTATGGVTLTLSALAVGKHRVRVRAKDGKSRSAEPVDLPFWIEAETFDPRDGLLYMLFTDRFADGDSKRESAGAEMKYPADWHGGDLQGALAVLKSDYFAKLGVRTIWISPVNQQVDGHFVGRDDANQYAAYHGYWPVKAREVERRFGGAQALRDFVNEAHARGIRVLVDLINNQVHEQHEYVTAHPDWFRRSPPNGTSCVCAIDANCGWSQRPFDCLFASYLPDINWTSAGAETQFIDDAINWVDEYDLDGFRVDAVKHVEPNSIFNLRATVTRRFEQGGHRIFMFGETAIGPNEQYSFFCDTVNNPKGGGAGYAWIDYYVGSNGLDGQFDFPTTNTLGEGLVSGGATLKNVANAYKAAVDNYQPGDLNVIFIGTQDSSRVASVAANDGNRYNRWGTLPPAAYTDAAAYQRIRRAFTLAFTAPGIPFLYNGDEVATPGGGDPDNRRNMTFADSALTSLQMSEPSTSALTLNQQQQDLLDFMRALGSTRAATRAFSRGSRTVLAAEDDFYAVAWAQGSQVGLVLVNRGPAVNNRTLTDGVFSGVTGFTLKAGKGSASVSGTTATVSIEAGEAGVLVSQ
jgi:neopullulanase